MSFINKLKKLKMIWKILKIRERLFKKLIFRDNIVSFEQRNAKLLKLIDYRNKITVKNIDVSIDRKIITN